MAPLYVLAALTLGPAFFVMLLRVNAAFVFLSLCLGDVLVQFVSNDAITVVGGASGSYNVSSNIIKLFLLLLPPTLTFVFMVRTMRSSWAFLNLLPALGVGLLVTLLVVPLMTPGLSHNVLASSTWQVIEKSQVLIVTASALVCLLFLWKQRPKSGEHGKRHKA